jgi:predicted nucleic acid-binding protein
VALIFDASAITNLIIARGSSALSKTKGNFALDLTGYEIGNAAWRLCLLERKLSSSEAAELLGSAVDFLGRLHQIRLEDLNSNRILDIAVSKRITFYDASYIAAGETSRLTIVTDDEKTARAANEYTSSKRSVEI